MTDSTSHEIKIDSSAAESICPIPFGDDSQEYTRIICRDDFEYQSSSNMVKVGNVTKYEWKKNFYWGNIVSLHKHRNFLAYALHNIVKTSSAASIVRVIYKPTQQRCASINHRSKIVDIAFADSDDAILGAVDGRGNISVDKIEKIADNQFKVERMVYVHRSDLDSPSPYCRLTWCILDPNMEDEDENDVHSSLMVAVLYGKRLDILKIRDVAEETHGMPVDYTDLETTMCLTNHQLHSDTIITGAFSPVGGDTFASASLDGQVYFTQFVFGADEDKIFNRVYTWTPHDGKPVHTLLFLDNLAGKQIDSDFWHYAVTGTKFNRELIIWNCSTWDPVHAISFEFASPESPLEQEFLGLKVHMDAFANFLFCSDIANAIFYIFSLDKIESEDGQVVYAKSVAEFKLAHPFIDFVVFRAEERLAGVGDDGGSDTEDRTTFMNGNSHGDGTLDSPLAKLLSKRSPPHEKDGVRDASTNLQKADSSPSSSKRLENNINLFVIQPKNLSHAHISYDSPIIVNANELPSDDSTQKNQFVVPSKDAVTDNDDHNRYLIADHNVEKNINDNDDENMDSTITKMTDTLKTDGDLDDEPPMELLTPDSFNLAVVTKDAAIAAASSLETTTSGATMDSSTTDDTTAIETPKIMGNFEPMSTKDQLMLTRNRPPVFNPYNEDLIDSSTSLTHVSNLTDHASVPMSDADINSYHHMDEKSSSNVSSRIMSLLRDAKSTSNTNTFDSNAPSTKITSSGQPQYVSSENYIAETHLRQALGLNVPSSGVSQDLPASRLNRDGSIASIEVSKIMSGVSSNPSIDPLVEIEAKRIEQEEELLGGRKTPIPFNGRGSSENYNIIDEKSRRHAAASTSPVTIRVSSSSSAAASELIDFNDGKFSSVSWPRTTNSTDHRDFIKADKTNVERVLRQRRMVGNDDNVKEDFNGANDGRVISKVVNIDNFVTVDQFNFLSSKITDLSAKLDSLADTLKKTIVETTAKSVTSSSSVHQRVNSEKKEDFSEIVTEGIRNAFSKESTTKVESSIRKDMDRFVKQQFKNYVTPALVKSVEPVKDSITSEVATRMTAIETLIGEQVQKSIRSKTVTDVIANAASDAVRTYLTTDVTNIFSSSILPSFTQSLDGFFKNLNDTFSTGTKEYQEILCKNLETYRKKRVEMREPLLLKVHEDTKRLAEKADGVKETLEDLERTQNKKFAESLKKLEENVTLNVRESLKRDLSEILMKEMIPTLSDAVFAKMSQSGILSFSQSPQHLTEGAIYRPASVMSISSVGRGEDATAQREAKRRRIADFIASESYQQAFVEALSAKDMELVNYVCEKVDPDKLFKRTKCPLTDNTILSLMQQASSCIRVNPVNKLKYLDESIFQLEQSTDAQISHHFKTILEKSVIVQLQKYANSPQAQSDGLLRDVRKILQSAKLILLQQ